MFYAIIPIKLIIPTTIVNIIIITESIIITIITVIITKIIQIDADIIMTITINTIAGGQTHLKIIIVIL